MLYNTDRVNYVCPAKPEISTGARPARSLCRQQEIADVINAARLSTDASLSMVSEGEAQQLMKHHEKRLVRQTFWNSALERVIFPVGYFFV